MQFETNICCALFSLAHLALYGNGEQIEGVKTFVYSPVAEQLRDYNTDYDNNIGQQQQLLYTDANFSNLSGKRSYSSSSLL